MSGAGTVVRPGSLVKHDWSVFDNVESYLFCRFVRSPNVLSWMVSLPLRPATSRRTDGHSSMGADAQACRVVRWSLFGGWLREAGTDSFVLCHALPPRPYPR